jgi:hypothetical protein
MPDGQDTYVGPLPDGSYVKIPANAPPEQMAAVRTKIQQMAQPTQPAQPMRASERDPRSFKEKFADIGKPIPGSYESSRDDPGLAGAYSTAGAGLSMLGTGIGAITNPLATGLGVAGAHYGSKILGSAGAAIGKPFGFENEGRLGGGLVGGLIGGGGGVYGGSKLAGRGLTMGQIPLPGRLGMLQRLLMGGEEGAAAGAGATATEPAIPRTSTSSAPGAVGEPTPTPSAAPGAASVPGVGGQTWSGAPTGPLARPSPLSMRTGAGAGTSAGSLAESVVPRPSGSLQMPTTVPEASSLPGAGGEAWSMQRKLTPELQTAVRAGDPGAISTARRLDPTYRPIIRPSGTEITGGTTPEQLQGIRKLALQPAETADEQFNRLFGKYHKEAQELNEWETGNPEGNPRTLGQSGWKTSQ